MGFEGAGASRAETGVPRAGVLLVSLALLMAAVSPATSAAPVPQAVDLAGDGAVTDSLSFGVYGASVVVTVWASSGIVAGPTAIAAAAGGAYSWSFSQVPDTSLLNLTITAWLPWDTNIAVTSVFDLSNGTPDTSYPGEALTLPFVATESVSLVAPVGPVVVPRGLTRVLPVEVTVDGNVSVAHSGPTLVESSPNVTAVFVGGAPADAKPPGASFFYNVSIAAAGPATPGDSVVSLTFASSSGNDLYANLTVRTVLNHQATVVSIDTVPSPPREAQAAQLVVGVANRGADFASGATVLVNAHNATEPNLYSNSTTLDLPPGGAAVNVTFAWTPSWSPTPVTVRASVFLANDYNASDDVLNATFAIQSTNGAPAVTLSAPTDGARAAGNITVSGTATDPEGGPVSVEFSVDGQSPFMIGTGPTFGFVWDIQALADGPHVLNATGVDDRGNRFTASATVIVLNRGPNAPPQVVVTSPREGDVVGDGAWVNGTASDERGELAAVFVSVDGGPEVSAAGLSNWSYFWNASADGPGPHALRVQAFDGIDRSVARLVNVTVNLTAPASLELVGVGVTPPLVQPNGAMQVTGVVRFDTGVFAQGAEVTGNLRGFAAVGAAAADPRGGFSFALPAPSVEGDYTLDVNARVGSLLGNATLPVRVARGNAPDLELPPGSLLIDPDPPLANRRVQHTVDIRNLGPVAANATLRVWDESGGSPVLIFEWSFSITAQRQASFDYNYSEGLHNLTLRIEGVAPPDVDLANNELKVSVRAHALPDFELVSLTPSRNDPVAGQNISFLAVIRNIGQVGGTITFELWDGPPAGANSTRFADEVYALQPNQEQRIVASWTTVAGEHQIYAALVLASPAELNLTNNVDSVTVHVTSPETPEPPVFLPGLGGAGVAAALGWAAVRRRGKSGPPRRKAATAPAARVAVVLLLAAALAAAAMPSPALARIEDADTVPGPLTGVCATCHTDPSGGRDLNSFGADFWQEKNATGGAVDLSRLGALDSDGDSYSNQREWSDGYLPGDPASNPTTGVRYSGFSGEGITATLLAAAAIIFVSLAGVWLAFTMVKRRDARLAARARGDDEQGEAPPK